MQAALVDLAQSGDQEALTTLVVQLRPGLLRLLRWVRASAIRTESPSDTESEVLGTLTETVLDHSLQRRPRLIAANVLLDTRQKIWRAQGRAMRSRDAMARAAWSGVGGDGGPIGHGERPELRPDLAVGAIDLVGDVAAALGTLPVTASSRRLTAEVAYRAWILDEPSGAIAAQVGLRPDAVRARLSRLRSAVRAGEGRPRRRQVKTISS